ncbi:hypothetical protein ABC345_01430 [Shouchella sp. 1P09AA]|uniref:hypothetical protein n=1 Tax=unclassified Shouchella TaxID=2893065 RepID=UPI0039A0CB39
MKYRYLFVPLLLFISGCSNESINTEDSETSDHTASTADHSSEDSVTIGYEYDWDNVERDLYSLESQLDQEDYTKIETFFHTFKLPEEGRLNLDEAREYYEQDGEVDLDYDFSESEIYYKNFLIFDEDTNMATSTNIFGFDSNTLDPIQPFETQAVGLFMSIVKELYTDGFVSPNGERVDSLGEELTEEEHTYLTDDSFYTVNQEENSLPKGWGALQATIDRIETQLEYIEPYLKEYQELHLWSSETRQYVQVADSISYHDYEEAYKYVIEATNNIERLVETLPDK